MSDRAGGFQSSVLAARLGGAGSSPAVVSAVPPAASAGGVSGAGGAAPQTAGGSAGGGLSPFSGAFASIGGLYRSPLFQQAGFQPTFGAAPHPVSSRASVAQPGSVPGSPFEQLLRLLRQHTQGVM